MYKSGIENDIPNEEMKIRILDGNVIESFLCYNSIIFLCYVSFKFLKFILQFLYSSKHKNQQISDKILFLHSLKCGKFCEKNAFQSLISE